MEKSPRGGGRTRRDAVVRNPWPERGAGLCTGQSQPRPLYQIAVNNFT